ncbi:MAG: hypothetical protein WDN00_15335 [Limisphaerales bacterium]
MRGHQRNRESAFSELSEPETDWLERFVADPGSATEDADAARLLIKRVLEKLSPPARLVITLLEIEGPFREGNRRTHGLVGAVGESPGVPGAG